MAGGSEEALGEAGMEDVLPLIITGLSIASILLLMALGLAVIYGTMGVINMAHGEFIMLGAYAAWALQNILGLGLILSLVPIFFLVGFIGWLVERGLIRFLYRRPLDTILATWGVGIILQQLVRLGTGAELRYIQMPPYLGQSVNVLGVTLSAYRIFLFLVACLLFALTWFLFNRTTWGMKLRAVVQNREISACFGIDSGQIYAMTFAYGAGLAGVAGALVAPLKSVSPTMGTGYVVDAFMVVVLGGVQALLGAVVSAGLLGQVSGILAFFSNDTIATAAVFLMVVIFIRFFPQGLLSRRVRTGGA